MEIFYPEDFNTLFGRGITEELPEKINEEEVDSSIENPDDVIECISKEVVKKDITIDENLKRNSLRSDDSNVSSKIKPMQLPPKEVPPKNSEFVIQQQKIGAADYPTYAVSPQALSVCLNKLTYIWQNDEKEYWSYIFYLDHVSFVGWRWNKYIKDWVYFGVDISKVEAFTCRR
ncbi:hypothetical protein [uncultured Clostridium sp.]|jgi:hypothetical protein|uniref:hypothetical protein n=1 Tax=uncultured Clostridium sp. TaxID=59620 RepID=UPI0026148135|nr:hypothetical protein [uncultured Clostridium sp.]